MEDELNEHLKGHKSLADMVSTHIGVWRRLLIHERSISITDEDVAYVDHELKALADIEAACAVEVSAEAGAD